MENDLEKNGLPSTNVGYYKEKLFRKIDTGSDAIVRSMDFDGVRHGKVIVVGISEFVIRESDGNNRTIPFDGILDIE